MVVNYRNGKKKIFSTIRFKEAVQSYEKALFIAKWMKIFEFEIDNFFFQRGETKLFWMDEYGRAAMFFSLNDDGMKA